MIDLTNDTEKLLRILAEDAVNWNGQPLVGGNYRHTPAMNGNLTDLKVKGLLTTFEEEHNDMFVIFTDTGKAEIAERYNIDINLFEPDY